jgi:Xaa-Pro dipeptidase
MRKCCVAFLWAACVLVLPLRAQDLQEPPLLPWSQQMAVRDAWLHQRHALILPMMRAHGIGMWIVVNEEFHDDPLTEFVAPPRPYAGNRDIFVFVDAAQAGLRRLAITGYAEESLKAFFESPDDPAPPEKALADLWTRFKPAKIALSFGGRRGVQRSITRDTYEFLASHMGAEAASRFMPAADLIEEYLDTRIPDEFDTYTALVQLTDVLTRRAFSNEVIVPGRTTVGDVRRWLFDALGARGLRTWFQPDLRVQRKGAPGATSRGFLAVSSESTVIERGDVLHVDFGITYMGLNSDWQKMAYVLREGETDVPAGLQVALTHTNALQDAVIGAARPGRTGGEVYQLAMDAMTRRGIEAKIYSHPIGNQGHGLGASIDYRASQREDIGATHTSRLRKGSYMSIELNTATALPEWDGQKVFVMMEDDAFLTDEGYRFFRPRQEAWYIIR